MKKLMVVLVMLLMSSLLFAEEKVGDSLQKMPDYFIGKYKLMGYTIDGKSHITVREKPSFAILGTCIIFMDDGLVQNIKAIIIQNISKNKKLDVAITFKENKEVWSFMWDDTSEYITVFTYKDVTNLTVADAVFIFEIVKDKIKEETK